MENIFCICTFCNEPILGETDTEWGEDYVELPDGTNVHFKCLISYAKQNVKEAPYCG